MKILVIEDEPKIAQAIKKGLELKNFAVDAVYDSDQGYSYALDPEYDLIILDRMLPGSMDGAKIAENLREDNIHTPILMLTARGTIGDKVSGLNAGADDYLVKPFSYDELIARVQALLRRPPINLGEELKINNLVLNTKTYQVKRGGQEIKLSHKEFALLEYLIRNQNQIVEKNTLVNHVWDEDSAILPNTIEVYIGYLRNKIDRPFKNYKPLIHTVRGFGYKLSEN